MLKHKFDCSCSYCTWKANRKPNPKKLAIIEDEIRIYNEVHDQWQMRVNQSN